MKKIIKHFLKGVYYKPMTNRTAEVIDAVKRAIIDISKQKESTFSNVVKDDELRMAESNRLISAGIGTIIVGVGIGASMLIKGQMMRKIKGGLNYGLYIHI